jgi:hypothetical protein
LKERAAEADFQSATFKMTLIPRLGSGETGLARM